MDKKVETTFEEIREILKDVSEKQAETFKGIGQLKDSQIQTDHQLKETDRQLKETDRQLKETDRQLKENAEELKKSKLEVDKHFKRLDNLFTGQWGKLMESLVEGDLTTLLQERGIEITSIAPAGRKGTRNGEDYEFDIIVINGTEIVVVEVKTTLDIEKVDHFFEKLGKFIHYIPEHKGKKIYGAMAYLKANQSSEKYAEKQGLFVIRATGSSSSIINKKDFKPREF